MSRHPSVGLIVVVVGLASCWSSSSRGDDPAALQALKDKGLSKSGTVFVIEDEKAALAKLKEVKATLAEHVRLLEKQAAVENYAVQVAQLDQQHQELKAELDQVNQQISQQSNAMNFRGGARANQLMNAPLNAQKAQLNASIAEVAQAHRNMKAQAPTAKDKTAIEEQLKKKGEEAQSALTEARPVVDAVLKKYAELKDDPSIKKAMDELKVATKANFKLGPSEAFTSAAKSLDATERRYLGKKPAATTRKKSGTKK